MLAVAGEEQTVPMASLMAAVAVVEPTIAPAAVFPVVVLSVVLPAAVPAAVSHQRHWRSSVAARGQISGTIKLLVARSAALGLTEPGYPTMPLGKVALAVDRRRRQPAALAELASTAAAVVVVAHLLMARTPVLVVVAAMDLPSSSGNSMFAPISQRGDA